MKDIVCSRCGKFHHPNKACSVLSFTAGATLEDFRCAMEKAETCQDFEERT
jgi:ribosomal protein L37E